MSESENERLSSQLSAPLEGQGLLLESVSVNAAGSRRKLTVIIDLLDTDSTEPVSMENIAAATKAIGEALEDDDVFSGRPYTLEVTSPGATRDLTEPRHFRRVVGRKLAIATTEPAKIIARLRAVTESGIELHDEKRGEELQLSFDQIDTARVELEFK